jgi:2-polyprenyl-3-methyl-5-hydroxy-6-metoxy-1,4-benzoquinol methylase
MPSFISTRRVQFAYFDRQFGHPDWRGKRVLDFGGNAGNILLDADCQIDPGNYWSIDVSRDAIAVGKQRHPRGNFIFYDRYNFEFNPTGEKDLRIPDPGVRFDFIIGWSVITHVSKAETLEFIRRSAQFLAAGGKAAFSFIDPWWTPPAGWARDSEFPETSNLQWRLEVRRAISPEVDVAGLIRQAQQTKLRWATLVNEDELIVDPDDDGISEGKPSRYYITFATEEYMRQLFPRAQVLSPVPPERMHCLIIDRDSWE